MYRTIDDFSCQWKNETESTLKLFAQLTDMSLRQKVTNDGRSLGMIAWHLVTTLGEMMHRAGLITDIIPENEPVPQLAKKMAMDYQTESRKIHEAVSLKWKDADLQVEVDMYGEPWKKGMVLMSLILHQAHHRGQLTVLMRQAGLTVPGVYGPSKEEWVQYGMPPQE